MSPDSAFLQAILDHPDDDAPRLMYADWLSEHGDARGEFIRLQIWAHHAPPDDPARALWLRRADQLLAQHRHAWLGKHRSVCYAWGFHRGFPEEITASAEAFIEHAPALFRTFPIRTARLLQAQRVLPLLVRCAHLGRLTALHLTDTKIEDRGLERLLDTAPLGELTTLRLGNNYLTDRAATALAECPRLSRLESLNLNRNHIGNSGAIALAHSPHLGRLTALHLADNYLGRSGIEVLALSPFLPRLTTFEVQLPAGVQNPWQLLRERRPGLGQPALAGVKERV